MGVLEAIWLKRARRGPMDPKSRAVAVVGRGLEGNANQGGKRQVTVISADAWDRVRAELGSDVDPSLRRANLLVRGVDLRDSTGRVLRIGSCRILVRGETRPCRLMDESCPGLQAALDPEWRAGVYGEVLAGGGIALGDGAGWEPEPAGSSVPMQ